MDEPLQGVSAKKGHTKVQHVWSALTACMPILQWAPNYPVSLFLVPDLAGGLTLGCILMGQSLAHADLCKVNLINGPYSCMLPPLVYAVFGSAIHGSVGTGGLVALLTGVQLVNYGDDVDYRTHVGAILTLEVGIILSLMGACKLAFLVRFLSRPALSGFITASALLIIFSQISPMIGLPAWASKGGVVHIALHHAKYFATFNPASVVMSAISLTFLMNAKRLKKIKVLKYIADFKELFLMSVMCVCTISLNERLGEMPGSADGSGLRPITVVGAMPSGLPSFSMPIGRHEIGLAKELLPGAILIAFVVFLSSFAGAKKFAMKDGYQVKALNELVALGFANTAGAFCGSVPTQIGLSRSAIAYGCGVKSQFGGNIIVACVVASITQAFSGYLYHVPKCVLNCIIVNGALHLPEFSEGKTLLRLARDPNYNWKSRMEFVVWIGGFACTLILGAFAGMVIAVGVSLTLILYQVVNPEITELGYRPPEKHDEQSPDRSDHRARKWLNIHNRGAFHEDGILVCRLEGPLFYANVESLQEWIDEQEIAYVEEHGKTYKGIILSAAAIPFMDTTAVSTLEEMIRAYAERGILFFAANTFGQTGRVIADRLELQMSSKLKTDRLKARVRNSSTIDDFVQLINENSQSRRAFLSRSFLSSRDIVATVSDAAEPP